MAGWLGDVHQYETPYFDPFTATTPVRPNMPYTPIYNVDPTGKPSVPILGVLAVAGIVLLFEWRRRKGGR